MLAILHALHKWRQYLLGSKFEVHSSLKHLLSQESLTEEQHKWIDKIQEFDFSVTYKRGKENTVADALSRRFEAECNAMVHINPTWVQDLKEEYENPSITIIIQEIQAGKKDNQWKLCNNTILLKGRIFLEKEGEFAKRALAEGHQAPQVGHVGYKKMYNNIRKNFYWQGMKTDIARFVAECDTCQRQKVENIALPGKLQPLNIPNQKWEDTSMEFITSLPNIEGKDAIWGIVNHLTKAHFIPICEYSRYRKLIESHLQGLCRLHGVPKVIVTKFTSKFWDFLLKTLGTQLTMSSAYHSQIDGQTEVVNKFLEGYLCSYVDDKQKEWNKLIHLIEWWYITSYHTSTKMTPFEALYGYPPPIIKIYISNCPKVKEVANHLQ
eukprot:Gb_03978 [translate_table: standard]